MGIKTSFFMGLFLLLFAACEHVPTNTKPNQEPFFDLKGYFDGEVQRLNGKGKAKKTVLAGGKQEERVGDSVDFKAELGVFAGADINRPAWSDKYVVDSSFNDQKELVRLHYKAVDEQQKTREIVVDFKKAAVTKVLIENNTSSAISTSSQYLTYQPAIGYTIENHQKVAMSDDQGFKVVVQFLK